LMKSPSSAKRRPRTFRPRGARREEMITHHAGRPRGSLAAARDRTELGCPLLSWNTWSTSHVNTTVLRAREGSKRMALNEQYVF
jgi:hypothetical protein